MKGQDIADRIIGLYGVGLGVLVFAAIFRPGVVMMALPLYAGAGFCAAGATVLANPRAATLFLEQRQPLRWAAKLLQGRAARALTPLAGFALLVAGIAIVWAVLAGRFDPAI
jgi:hypothetical protein